MSASNDNLEEGSGPARHARHAAGSGEGRKPRFAQPGSQPRFAQASEQGQASHSAARKPRFSQEASPVQQPASATGLREWSQDQYQPPADQARPTAIDDAAFSHIQAADGAVLTTRRNASEAASAATRRLKDDAGVARVAAKREQASRKRLPGAVMAVIGIVALAVIVGAFVLVRGLMTSSSTQGEAIPGEETQVSASVDEDVTYNGREFALVEGEDGWQLVSGLGGDSHGSVEAQFEGIPVALIRYDEAFLIPENLDDGTWDVYAYTFGDGSVAIRLTDADGNPYVGDGQLVSAELEGNALALTDSDGNTTTIPLG